jgi:hypothetical protein
MDWISNMFSTSFGKWRQATFFDESEDKEKLEKKEKENVTCHRPVSKIDSRRGNKTKSLKKSGRSSSKNSNNI